MAIFHKENVALDTNAFKRICSQYHMLFKPLFDINWRIYVFFMKLYSKLHVVTLQIHLILLPSIIFLYDILIEHMEGQIW